MKNCFHIEIAQPRLVFWWIINLFDLNCSCPIGLLSHQIDFFSNQFITFFFIFFLFFLTFLFIFFFFILFFSFSHSFLFFYHNLSRFDFIFQSRKKTKYFISPSFFFIFSLLFCFHFCFVFIFTFLFVLLGIFSKEDILEIEEDTKVFNHFRDIKVWPFFNVVFSSKFKGHKIIKGVIKIKFFHLMNFRWFKICLKDIVFCSWFVIVFYYFLMGKKVQLELIQILLIFFIICFPPWMCLFWFIFFFSVLFYMW